ncbi:MAG: SH3 domain-containing protein [Yoonia sp.]
MSKFNVGTFLMLGFGFYQLSGGADFEPEVRALETAVISTKSIEIVPFDEPVVSRAPVEVAAAPLAETETPVIEPEVVQASLEVAPTVAEVAVELDLREVSGKRVNMRAGPSTNDAVLDTLVRGTQIEVLDVNADGWARLRVLDTDQVGWMAERFLAAL